MKVVLALMTAGAICATSIADEVKAGTAKEEKTGSCCMADEVCGYGCVDAKGLKTLMDTKTPIVLIDARSGKYDDGQRIPGAKQLSPEAADADIAKVLPSKDALIVAYCTSLKCPASKMLAEKLVKMGYKNIIKYPGGIEEWIKLGNPVEKAAK